MRRSRVWSPTRMCKLLWNSISFSLICSWRVCLWVCVWLWCIIAENVRVIVFVSTGRMDDGVVCFLIACCQLCIHWQHVCEYGEDNRTENVFDICFVVLVVVSSSLVLILLTGTTLEWCDKNNKDQHDLHLLFSLSLVSSMSCSCVCGCVDGCVTIWRVNRKEKKSVSCN